MRITLVISYLGSGGAERVMSKMANWWAEKGHDITLITYNSVVSDHYKLHPAVKRNRLNLRRDSPNLWLGARNNLIRLRSIRGAIKMVNPDIIISFLDRTNVNTLMACLGLTTPVIVSERTDPTVYSIGGYAWQFLRKKTYPRAAAVVVQTETVRQWALTFLNEDKVYVIPNPVERPVCPDGLCERDTAKGYVLIGMGRLGSQKGFDLLIRAFSRCAGDFPDWSLVIYGEGSERSKLESLIHELGREGRIELPGVTKEPEQALRQADLFVMSSRFEGFPNALLEAMAVGLPVISTDCPSGPREIIRDGVDGLLVPNEDVGALASAMRRLMSDPEERRRLGQRATEVCERFSTIKVMAMWEEIICRVTHRPKM